MNNLKHFELNTILIAILFFYEITQMYEAVFVNINKNMNKKFKLKQM